MFGFRISEEARIDNEHRVLLELPDAQYLFEIFFEILKGIQFYRLSYRAVFRYSMKEMVPKISQLTMITFVETDMVVAALRKFDS